MIELVTTRDGDWVLPYVSGARTVQTERIHRVAPVRAYPHGRYLECGETAVGGLKAAAMPSGKDRTTGKLRMETMYYTGAKL